MNDLIIEEKKINSLLESGISKLNKIIDNQNDTVKSIYPDYCNKTGRNILNHERNHSNYSRRSEQEIDYDTYGIKTDKLKSENYARRIDIKFFPKD